MENPNAKIPAFAEAAALRKASGGGASRRQANVKSQNQDSFYHLDFKLDLILIHLRFITSCEL